MIGRTVLAAFIFCTGILQAEEFESWVRSEVARCRETGAHVISVPKGTHHAWSAKATPKTLHLSNNDDGRKHLLFDLSGMTNLVIEGNGAELIMHGHIIPFFMRDAQNITIRNLVIDWEHPFFGQGEILGVGEGWFDVRFEREYPVSVVNGELFFMNPDLPELMRMRSINFYDPQQGRVVYRSTDEYNIPLDYKAEIRKDGTVRIHTPRLQSPIKPGHVGVFQYEGRSSPAVAAQRCRNIRLESVTEYHAAAIANLFEGVEDVYLSRVQVVPRPGSGRFFSSHHDASHFVDCRGDIHVHDCQFECQGDDSGNIHGVYRPVFRKMRDTVLRVKLIHFQQIGVDTLNAGDNVGFYHADTLEMLGEGRLASVLRPDAQTSDLVFAEPLPELVWSKVVVALREHDVDVEISGCRFAHNRARGWLIKTLGRVRIHDNYFRVQGTFEIDPTLGNPASEVPIFGRIRIHHNRIHQIYRPLIIANNVEGFEFYENKISPGADFPMWHRGRQEVPDIRFGVGVTIGRFQKLNSNRGVIQSKGKE